MTNIDQAARRAAEKLAGAINRGAEKSWLGNDLWDAELISLTSQVIAAEFAPLKERLVEAERLIERAKKNIASFVPIHDDIDKFLAAKPEEANDVATD